MYIGKFNDACATPSQYLIGCITLSQEYWKLIYLYNVFENNEKATWNTKMPHYSYPLPIIDFRKFKRLNDFGEVLL